MLGLLQDGGGAGLTQASPVSPLPGVDVHPRLHSRIKCRRGPGWTSTLGRFTSVMCILRCTFFLAIERSDFIIAGKIAAKGHFYFFGQTAHFPCHLVIHLYARSDVHPGAANAGGTHGDNTRTPPGYLSSYLSRRIRPHLGSHLGSHTGLDQRIARPRWDTPRAYPWLAGASPGAF